MGLKIFEVLDMEKDQKLDVIFAMIIFLLFGSGAIVVFVISIAVSNYYLLIITFTLILIGFLLAKLYLKKKAKKDILIYTKSPRKEEQIAPSRQPILNLNEEKLEKKESLLNLDEEDEVEEEFDEEIDGEDDETETIKQPKQSDDQRIRDSFED